MLTKNYFLHQDTGGLKVATMASGIGAPEQAIKNLGVKHKVVFACEIDKYARQTYEANHEAETMYTDMTKEQWDKPEDYADLVVGGIPCQAFSLAGKRLGELDPRGLLFFDFYRYLKNQRPKVFIIENVKGLLSDNAGKTFQNWLLLLGNSVNGNLQMFNHPDSLGYNLHYTVLNSKNFGVPQNRERVFIVGIRSDLPNSFSFPKGWPLTIRLKDILEPVVDEKYYLSEKALDYLTRGASGKYSDRMTFLNKDTDKTAGCITANHSKGVPYNMLSVSEPYVVGFGRSEEEKERRRNHYRKTGKDSGSFKDKTYILKEQSYSDTILASPNPVKDGLIAEPLRISEATKKGYAEAYPGDSINLSNPNSNTRRGRVGEQIANTLDTACNQAVIEPQRIAGWFENENVIGAYRGDAKRSSVSEAIYHKPDAICNTVIAGNPPKVFEPQLSQIGQIPGFESSGRVYDADGLSCTIKANGGGGGAKTGYYLIDGVPCRIRRLTPLECARLQAFPDSFIWPVSDTQRYKQCGNSITVTVMQEIIRNLLNILK